VTPLVHCHAYTLSKEIQDVMRQQVEKLAFELQRARFDERAVCREE
jgi:hypothetical protein